MTSHFKFLLLLLSVMVLTNCNGGDNSSSNMGGAGGSLARFTISGDYLYIVDNSNLKIFDVSIPDQPDYLESKEQNLGFGIETIFPMDTLLFIGSQTGMFIYDISRPGFPQQVSYTFHLKSCDPVVASGNYAYVTLNSENVWCGRSSNVLQIYDISNIKNPLLIHTESGFISPKGLGVDGEKLFICDNGLKVYDVSNPNQLIWKDDLSHISEIENIDTYDVIPLNGKLLLIGADGLFQFDYTGEKLAFVSKIDVYRD